jgi:hypothetical protein
MSTQRYSVKPHPIGTLLTWVESSEIAVLETEPAMKATQTSSIALRRSTIPCGDIRRSGRSAPTSSN